MILANNTLQLDIKVQDAQRAAFAKLAGDITSACVILGDSDIDYSLSPNVANSAILNALYSVPAIKSKLLYNGIGANLSGTIKCFVRKVLSDGTVQSLYDYNTDSNWISGTTPPTLANGKDWTQLTFDNTQMGYILFFETVLDYYFTPDGSGTKERLPESLEKYTFTISWNGSSTIPAGWDVVEDLANGSMLIAKKDTTASPISLLYNGAITAVGNFSTKEKTITFNF